MQFFTLPPCNQAESGDSVYADCVRHCPDYYSMLVAGDLITSSHELSHGVNNRIRNENGGRSAYMYRNKSVSLPQPTRVGPNVGTVAVNGFYCLGGRALIVEEPPFRKTDVIKHIPESLRGFRFSTYVSGQQAWDDQPLYLFDEWTAYINGAICAVELAKIDKAEPGSDWVCAPLEFVAYGVAVAMEADAKECLMQPLADTCRFHLLRAFNVFLDGRALFPFEGQNALYEMLKSGAGGASIRNFLKEKLAFVVPDTVQPEETIHPDNPWWI